jgi:phage shock protein A
MANILKRFGDIMSANINALLDKAEDPEKMIDKYLRDIEEDLRSVKAETAAVMAAETKAKRELDECGEEIDKLQKYAEKALLAGNEGDARKFLEKKAQLTEKKNSLQQTYDVASANAAKMKEMHDKLVKDMDTLQAKRDAIKAKVAVAKTQEKLNKMGTSVSGAGEAMAAFERMEAKADKMLDEANAMSELNSKTDSVDELAAKYDSAADSSSVDDELAALKAKMGL